MTIKRSMTVEKEKILVVDDEEAIREVVSTLLEAQGYVCTVRQNGRLAAPTRPGLGITPKAESLGSPVIDVGGV